MTIMFLFSCFCFPYTFYNFKDICSCGCRHPCYVINHKNIDDMTGPTNDSPHSHHHHHNTGASEYEAVRVVYGHPADSVGHQQSPAEVRL